MKSIVVIPARFGSTRFPGKPLAEIAGKPMILWTIEGAKKSKLIQDFLVATDSEKISDLIPKSLAGTVMTDSSLPTGTDRVWKAVENLDVDIVINVQGDEPLIDGRLLDLLVDAFKDPKVEMATLARSIKTQEELVSETTAKIATDHNSYAIYFSRFPIPFSRDKSNLEGALKHIGIYAYRKSSLKDFCAQSPCSLEISEGLEQLRALYLGMKIKVLKVDSDSYGVDIPSDIEKIEKILKGKENG